MIGHMRHPRLGWRRSVTSSWVLIRYCGSPSSSSTVMRRVRNSRKPSWSRRARDSLRFPIASSRAPISFASRGLKMSAAETFVASRDGG